MVERIIKVWQLTRTRVLWGWRFHSLGRRSVVGKCRFAANPGAVSIGHHAIVGAKAAVVKDVGSHSILVGAPARMIERKTGGGGAGGGGRR